MNIKKTTLWVLRIIPSLIMIQTLFFKFSGSAESVFIFSALEMEPWGRIGIGIAELVASILILTPKFTPWGALLSSALMSGALFAHLTKLGIEVQGDHGLLFGYALIVLIFSVILIITEKSQLLTVSKRFIVKR